MSEQQMQNILESLERDEKQVQDRLIKKGHGTFGTPTDSIGEPIKTQRKKDW